MRDAENAISSTEHKTASYIFSVCNKQIEVPMLFWLDMPVMKPQQ